VARYVRSSATKCRRGLGSTHLKFLSSSITCIPLSYCSRDAASPTEAKWLFMILPGCVRDCGSEGRREELGDEWDVGSAIMKG